MKITGIQFCPYCGGKLERAFREGRQRLVCSSCDAIYYQNPLPAATALVINDGNQLLLGKRAVDPARGMWCLPGGFIEMGETMEQAALRELHEETGLTGCGAGFVGCFYQDSRTYGGVIIFGYRVAVTGGVLQAGDDMDAVRYVDLDKLPPLAFDAHQKLVDELKRQVQDAT
jgi:8-oxo-dGTP diphosphatase